MKFFLLNFLLAPNRGDGLISDDKTIEEVWKPKQIKHSYFLGTELQKLASPKNLAKLFSQTEKTEANPEACD